MKDETAFYDPNSLYVQVRANVNDHGMSGREWHKVFRIVQGIAWVHVPNTQKIAEFDLDKEVVGMMYRYEPNIVAFPDCIRKVTLTKPNGWRNVKLGELAEKLGVISPVAYLFKNDPPAYWVLNGDNIDTEDLGMNFEQAKSALERGEAMHGGKINLLY